MHDLSQRLEAALATATTTLLSTHAHLCRAATVRLASWLPPTRTIALYCRAHDPTLQELLDFIHAYARTVLLKIHVRNALRFAAALRPEFSGPAAVALYIERMDVSRTFSGAVYALAVAQLGAARFAALLPAAATTVGVTRSTGESVRAHAMPSVVDPAARDTTSRLHGNHVGVTG